MTIGLISPIHDNLILLPGAILSAISVFFVLSSLLVPYIITAFVSVIMSVVVLGLTRVALRDQTTRSHFQKARIRDPSQNAPSRKSRRHLSYLDIIFLCVYIASLLVASLISEPNKQLFISWDQFGFSQILQLAAAILLCFFAPGYAIVNIIDNKRHEVRPLLRLLLAYVLSILVTGLSGYTSAYLEHPASLTKSLLVGVNLSILVIFSATNLRNSIYSFGLHYAETADKGKKLTIFTNKNREVVIVFAALLALVILSTYYLYQGVIIGDQWFHHGRSLLFTAGAFTSVLDVLYPFFFHTVLGSFFSLSGVPSVNAYVSINFLNILPVLAFYYFSKKWIPNYAWQRVAVLASALFMLSSGFGWVNVLSLTAGANNMMSHTSALETLHLGALQTGDIQQPTTFIDTAQPEPTSPLLLISLPTGFILLGLVKKNLSGRIKYLGILVAITTLGILSHDEFYLFVITASILPLAFKLPKRNSLYAAFLISLSIVIFAENIFPVKYYTFREVVGIPLVYLVFFFVGSIWILYGTGVFRKVTARILGRLTRKEVWTRGTRLGLSIVLVAVVSYFYLFTFVVWAQVSLTEVNANTRYVPWYLYPMKFGTVGMLGIAFLLSYFFKRFEKEVLVFGIIAAVAFVAGPYYDEHRFSKYMMVGMVGFASLLVYRVIFSFNILTNRPIFLGLIMGLVVTSSSLSTFLFIGYTALALDDPGFEGFHKQLPRRIFPSLEDIRFLNFLHNDLINLTTDYVTVLPDWWGINSKLEGFVGTSLASLPKFLQSPNTLSSSTIEGFYNLLNYSNSRYIILKENETTTSYPDVANSEVFRFAIENFKKVYLDENYMVIAVPSLAPPSMSNAADVAMIHPLDGSVLSSELSEEKVLLYNDEEFDNTKDSNAVRVGKIDETAGVTIYGDKERTTFWSKPLQDNEVEDINYIETTFRMIGENKTSNDAGIIWNDGNKEFTVSVKNDRLEVLSEPRDLRNSKEPVEKKLINIRDMKRENGVWYTLKIALMEDSANIYVNDILAVRVLKTNNQPESRFYQASNGNIAGDAPSPGINNETSVSRVGLFSDDNIAQFKSIKIGRVSDTIYQKGLYNSHYYPLSALALSKIGYETFVEGDFSALSKKIAIITWDPAETSQDNNRYLQFVKKGGTLVILNRDNNFDGKFSKFLSIKAGNETKFNSILHSEKQREAVNISGVVRAIYSEAPEAVIKSFYRYDDKKVSPFAIEKIYGESGGRIIFVNGAGFFDAIFRSPEKSFLLLSDIPGLIDIAAAKYQEVPHVPETAISGARFDGELKISGHSTINSSSLVLPRGSSTFHVRDIVTEDALSDPDVDNRRILPSHLNNVEIGNLTLYGDYESKVNSTGTIHLPSSPSHYDYVDIPIPPGSNLTLKLSKGASAEFMTRDDSKNFSQPIRFANAGEIRFHEITSHTSSPEVSPSVIHFLMKSPEFKVTGDMDFGGFYNPNSPDSNDRITYKGNSVTRFDHVDNHITYLGFIQNSPDANTDKQPLKIKLPGNIHRNANDTAKAFGSTINTYLLMTIVLVTAFTVWRFVGKNRLRLVKKW